MLAVLVRIRLRAMMFSSRVQVLRCASIVIVKQERFPFVGRSGAKPGSKLIIVTQS